MNNLFIATNSSHLIQIQEARFKFVKTDDQNFLVVFCDKKEALENLKKEININDWTQIFYFYKKIDFLFDNILFIPSRFKFQFKKIIRKLRFKKFVNQIKQIEVNHFFGINFFTEDLFIRPFINEMEYHRLFLLDDGTSTIGRVNEIRQHFSKNQNSNVFFGVKLKESITFFTSYPINVPREKDIIVKNEFSFLKSQIIEPNKFNQEVYFLGAPLYLSYFSIDVYVDLLKRTADKLFAKYQCNVFYIPHRMESEKYLKAIEEALPLKIVHKPIELAYVYEPQNRARYLASFFSSGLFNCAEIFSHLSDYRFDAFYLKDVKRNKIELENLYQCYNNSSLSNLKINEDY